MLLLLTLYCCYACRAHRMGLSRRTVMWLWTVIRLYFACERWQTYARIHSSHRMCEICVSGIITQITHLLTSRPANEISYINLILCCICHLLSYLLVRYRFTQGGIYISFDYFMWKTVLGLLPQDWTMLLTIQDNHIILLKRIHNRG